MACGWLVAIVSVIPPFFNVAPYHLHKDIGICLPDFATPNAFWYAIVFSVCTFIIPGSLIILSNIKVSKFHAYLNTHLIVLNNQFVLFVSLHPHPQFTQVFMIARYHRHRIAAAIFEVTLSAQVTITHQRNPFPLPFEAIPQKLRARSPITSVFQIIASFILLYCPYYLIIFWNSMMANVYNGVLATKFQLPNVFMIVAFTLMHLTIFVNIIIYGLKSKAMRKSIQNYWRKKRTKHEINVEIQARTPSTCGSRRPSLNAININRSISNRRLSETYINLTGRNGTARQQMKRIASELLWQPTALQIDSAPIEQMPHASSVTTLQIPSHDIETDNGESIDYQLYHSSIARASRTIARPITCVPHSKSSLSIATSLLNRVFRFDTNSAYHQCHETSQSPRILITTAQSNDNDSKTHSTTFQMTSNKQHKWADHVSNGIDDECDADDNDDDSDTTPFAKDLYAMVSKRCLSLDDQTNYANDLYTNDIGQPLLFSWPTTRKKYKNLAGYQLKVNPLYGDRCEEPEIIL